jgi:hypothetical protein
MHIRSRAATSFFLSKLPVLILASFCTLLFCCYICNMAHRSTLYRRRKLLEHGKPRGIGGRSEKSGRRDQWNLQYSASLIRSRRTLPPEVDVDYEEVRKNQAAYLAGNDEPSVQYIMERLSPVMRPLPNGRKPFSPELIAVCTCDALKLGRRIRSPRRSVQDVAKMLHKHCPQLSEQDVLTYARSREPWVDEVIANKVGNHTGSVNCACPSKVFRPRISRRMVSYWRHSKDYRACLKLIRELAYSDGETFEASARSWFTFSIVIDKNVKPIRGQTITQPPRKTSSPSRRVERFSPASE